jgi:hypothetical protein
MTIHLISSGESSGKLEDMLDRAAQSQDRELDGLLTALVGPLGAAAHCCDGTLRHGHCFCNAPADLRDESANSLDLTLHGRRIELISRHLHPPG